MLSRPLMEVAIEPVLASDADLLEATFARVAADDPQLSFGRDWEGGSFLLGGMSENSLDGAITRARAGAKVKFTVGAPQVAYRELLGRPVQIAYVHKRIFGPRCEFAKVVIDFAPQEAGTGFVFENNAGSSVPDEFVPGVERGLQISKEQGLRAGFPLEDFKAVLVGGAYHDIDSSVLTFQIAAQAAFRELKEKGDILLAEPFMAVEVVSPVAFITSVVGDLKSRRGVIQAQSTRDGAAVINAVAPLANMFGYANALNSVSQNGATYTMRFDRYRPVPLPDGDGPFSPASAMRA